MERIAELLLASGNRGKRAEFARLLAGLPVALREPTDFSLATLEIDEDGATFTENARIKARAYAAAAGIPALADDSGLCVSALGGAPGIHSARFGGAELDDAGRRRFLLQRLEAAGNNAERSAEFRCALCMATPDGDLLGEALGRCAGRIARSERAGPHGFGYDALFIPDGEQRSFAQLADEQKDALSHRARALDILRFSLLRWLAPA